MRTQEDGTKPRMRGLEWIVRNAEVAGIATIAAVAGAVGILGIASLTGCGSGEGGGGGGEKVSVVTAESPTPGSGQGSVVTPAVTVPLAASPGAPIQLEVEDDSTPPDAHILLEDTLVEPGETVEIVVHTTPDANRVLLSDGLQDPQALVRDAGSNTWRVNYRVPLRPQHERWGLSVTAKNEANRWRRVWVFLELPKETSEASSELESTKEPVKESVKPDSTTGTER
ncbi:MAG: hypothetical protein ACREOU_10900 [Candidatus Eiseniibacteriota bacterium]